MFPKEVFVSYDGVMIAKSRLEEAKKGNGMDVLNKEIGDCNILIKNNHSPLLIPDKKKKASNPDAIVDGFVCELKEVSGKKDQVWKRLKKGTTQSNGAVVIFTTNNYSSNEIINMIKGKFIQALKDNKNYKYPFNFNTFLYYSNDGKERIINTESIWNSVVRK